jgi:hypothetical protein
MALETMSSVGHCRWCDTEGIVVDQGEHSETLACAICRHCTLQIGHQKLDLGFKARIPLRHFHLKRGNGPYQRPLDSRPTATSLVDHLTLDVWPSMAAIVDFGIDTGLHYGALQHAVLMGITAYELDRVLGDGVAITMLVTAIPDQPYGSVRFRTAYDDLPWNELEEEAE